MFTVSAILMDRIFFIYVGEICKFAFEKTDKICNYPFIAETPSRIYTFFVLVPRK